MFLPPYRSEVHFFDRNYDKGLNYYKKKYHRWNGQKAIGDITPSYMQDLHIAGLIYKDFPSAKIIFCLRNPMERTYSAYWHLYRNTKFDLEFKECFSQNHKIFKRSLYYEKIKTYCDLFPRKNILVLFYEDLKKNPLGFLNRICDFIDVKPINSVTNIDFFKKANVAVQPRSILLYRFIKRVVRRLRFLHCEKIDFFVDCIGKSKLRRFFEKPMIKKNIDRKLEQRIKDYFSGDIKKLEDLLGVNLDFWKH